MVFTRLYSQLYQALSYIIIKKKKYLKTSSSQFYFCMFVTAQRKTDCLCMFSFSSGLNNISDVQARLYT